MDVSLLTQADFTLSRCGRPLAPRGLSVVYIPKGFLFQQYFPVSSPTLSQTIVKEITGNTVWCLRSIQFTTSPSTSLSVQVMLPDGRFLFNNLIDVGRIAGYGSYRYLFTKEKECPPGSKLQVTLTDIYTSVAQPLAALFEGAYKYFLRKGSLSVDTLIPCTVGDAAAGLPRYPRNQNQNIMAPCWMQGAGPATPEGLTDTEWTYSAQGLVTNALGQVLQGATAIDVAAGPFTATQVIPIDSGSDFRCRRLLFAVTADDTVSAGTFLGKVRTGSGYALCDDYFDLATYIGSSPMPHDWEIKASDFVYIDLQLVDQAGTGNIYLQSFLEGVKRSRR